MAISAVALCAGVSAAPVPIIVDTSVSYKLKSTTGLVLGIQSASRTAGAAALLSPDDGAPDHLWIFMPAGKDQYKIVNAHSGEPLAVRGTDVIQSADSGAAGHTWRIGAEGSGYRGIQNVDTGLMLELGIPGQLWQLIRAEPAYPAPHAVAGDVMVHDPSIVKTADGSYYLFGTHGGIRMQSSTDRIHFMSAGQAFSADPSWISAYTKQDIWAPDVSYHNGKYWLYYAVSSFGKNTSAIGLATSTTAAPGSWRDRGIVYSSQPESNYNAIDPGLIVDASGDWWLSLGSFWTGLYMIRIDPATGKQLVEDRTMRHLAQRITSTAIEAAFIYRHNGYYYLFVSLDQCCRGVNSTYHIAVGRSKEVIGPYSDRGGVAILQGGGTILLSTHGDIIGPGGQSVLRDADGDVLVYHYYDGSNNGARTLGMNLISWDSEDWPHVK